MSTAERIYVASTSEDLEAVRLAETLARRIEDDIAAQTIPPGGVMGSLRELSERYSVGRAAAREGVALLERRGLGRLRPGPYGGFIVAKPSSELVGATLADYFRMIGTTRTQIGDAREALDLTVADCLLAAGRAGEAAKALPDPLAATTWLDWHLELRSTLASQTAEPALGMFAACPEELTREVLQEAAEPADWRDQAARLHAELVAGLAAADAEAVAAALADLQNTLGPWTEGKGDGVALPEIDMARHADDRTLATLVARRMAHEILHRCSPGHRLGSEWDLCERYNVSRATLRQAIRQLQDSGLVECRRGRGNGMVVRDPRGTGSIRLAVAFLISHQMDPGVAGTILFQLNRFVPALAVGRATVEDRIRLAETIALAGQRDPIDRYDLLRLVQLVSELANSPIIDIFSRCLAAYEARFHPFLVERLPVRLQADYFALLARLIDQATEADRVPLDEAKDRAAAVMLEMSVNRPF
jgi:DNA-binding FadR family transcriptional regulator